MAKRAGYRYASLQHGGQCFASNSFGKYGKRPDRECRMRCARDKGRFCGAGWRNSVFRITGVRVQTFVYRHRTILGETYRGCYVDKGRRDLEKYFGRINNYKACFLRAKRAGYRYASL